MFYIPERFLETLIEEDIHIFDMTTYAMKIENKKGSICCYPKRPCVIAGVEEAKRLFEKAGACAEIMAENGSRLEAGEICLRAYGTAGQLHSVYKTAQNVMEYSSGIAGRCARMVENARRSAPNIEICVTRKHFPGTKRLSIKAALAGGASPHRLWLSDSILVFDQHRIFAGNADNFTRLVKQIVAENPEKKIAVEANSAQEALLFAEAGAEIIQCERFTHEILQETTAKMKVINPRIKVSVAGGIDADNATEYAAAGVDILVTSWVYFGKPEDIKMKFEATD